MIGIIGGYGSIGTEVVKRLTSWGYSAVKAGGRSPEKVEKEFKKLFPEVKLQKVDFENSRNLSRFIDGCSLLINCSGPSYKTAYRIASSAMEMGVDYVDVGMDAGMEQLKGRNPEKVLVYCSGTSQGLSGILQRVVLDHFERAETLEYSFGGISPYSETGATDFIQGIVRSENRSMVKWENGITGCGIPVMDTEGLFADSTQFYPFFDEESDYIVNNYSIKKGIWNFAIEGVHFNSVLRRARFTFQTDPQKTVRDICESSLKDAEEFHRQIKFYLKATGLKNGTTEEHVLSLKTEEQHVLSGAVTAATAVAVLKGEVAPGVYNLVEIDDPQSVYRRIGNVDDIHIETGSSENEDMDEGVI